MELRIPESLREHVTFSGGVLRFRQTAGSSLRNLIAALAAGFRPTGIRARTEVRVSKEGIRFGISGTLIPHAGHALRLVGAPGHPAKLFVNDAPFPLLSTEVSPPGEGPWTTDDLLWLATTLTNLLKIPLQNEWDREAWIEWNQDPIFRGQAAVFAKIAKSELTFPEAAKVSPTEPPGVIQMESSIYTLQPGPLFSPTIALERSQLRTPTWILPWESIHTIGVLFIKREGDPLPLGMLVAAHQDQVLELIRLENVSLLDAAHLHFIAGEIEARIEQFTPIHGSPEDIPLPLQRMR